MGGKRKPFRPIPDDMRNLPAPLLSALTLTSLLPHLPVLATFDERVKRFFWRVGNRVPHAGKALGVGGLAAHGFLLGRWANNSASLVLASSISVFDVFGVFFWKQCNTYTASGNLAM